MVKCCAHPVFIQRGPPQQAGLEKDISPSGGQLRRDSNWPPDLVTKSASSGLISSDLSTAVSFCGSIVVAPISSSDRNSVPLCSKQICVLSQILNWTAMERQIAPERNLQLCRRQQVISGENIDNGPRGDALGSASGAASVVVQ